MTISDSGRWQDGFGRKRLAEANRNPANSWPAAAARPGGEGAFEVHRYDAGPRALDQKADPGPKGAELTVPAPLSFRKPYEVFAACQHGACQIEACDRGAIGIDR